MVSYYFAYYPLRLKDAKHEVRIAVGFQAYGRRIISTPHK